MSELLSLIVALGLGAGAQPVTGAAGISGAGVTAAAGATGAGATHAGVAGVDGVAMAPYRLTPAVGASPEPPARPVPPQEERFPLEDRWFAEDKAMHFMVSYAATALAYGAARTAGLEWPEAGAVAGGVAGAAGLWKEFHDRRRGRPFSVRDLVWDGLGIAGALALAARTP